MSQRCRHSRMMRHNCRITGLSPDALSVVVCKVYEVFAMQPCRLLLVFSFEHRAVSVTA